MRRLTQAFLILPLLISCYAWADIEPPLKDLIPLYSVENIDGAEQVWIQKSGTPDWVSAKEGDNLQEGDSIKVGKYTTVVLNLKKDTFVQAGQNTQLQVKQLADQGDAGFLTRIALQAGRILSDVRKNLAQTGSSFEVESGGVVCGVRGTVFEISNTGGDVETTTHEGSVEMKGSNGTQTIKAGETCHWHHGQNQWKKPCSSKTAGHYSAWKARKAACLARRANPHAPRHPLSARSHTAHH